MKKNNTILFLTIAGILLMGVFVVLGYTKSSGKIFMNGELQSKHTGLANNCAGCHTPFKGVGSSVCVTCHTEKKHYGLIAESAGSKVLLSSAKSADCFDCHMEHRGKRFNNAVVDAENCLNCHTRKPHQKKTAVGAVDDTERGVSFPHDLHSSMGIVAEDNCTTCHGASSPADQAQGQAMVMRLTAKFGDQCATCHQLDDHGFNTEDYAQCSKCHTNGNFGATTWPSESSPRVYSHRLHLQMNCTECHGGVLDQDDEEATTPALTRPAIADCFSCHTERYIDTGCTTCHTYHPQES